MSLPQCLLTEIRNHAPQGEHDPPSVWNEKCCPQQKASTISFNDSIISVLECLRSSDKAEPWSEMKRDRWPDVMSGGETVWWMQGLFFYWWVLLFLCLCVALSTSINGQSGHRSAWSAYEVNMLITCKSLCAATIMKTIFQRKLVDSSFSSCGHNSAFQLDVILSETSTAKLK